MKAHKKKSTGFTLVELMVVLVILGIISVGTITAIISQSKVYHSEEDIIDMQMNARIAMDRASFLIRMAGVGCSDSFGNKLTSGNLVTNGDVAANPLATMFVTTNNNVSTPDQLTMVGAVAYAGTITGIPANNQITLNTQNANLNASVAAKKYIFISPQDENRFETIAAISGNTITLSNSFDSERKTELINSLTAGVTVNAYQVQAFTIRLVNNSLRIDENLVTSSTQLDVSDNIQDLQFQYGLDTNADDDIDSWLDSTTDIDQIRAVRIFILARTNKVDRDFIDRKTYTLAGVTVGPFTGTDVANLNTHRGVHRYLLESTVAIRNRNF